MGAGHDDERPAEAGPTDTPASVGLRVTAVLSAAEQAAEEIRAEAEADAKRIRDEAEARAVARVEELTGEPERLVAEAHADAERTRAEAEAEIRSARKEAVDAAREFEQHTRQRQAELAEQIRAVEEERQNALARVREALRELHGATSQLESVVATADPGGVEQSGSRWPRLRRSRVAEPRPELYEALHESVAEAKQNGDEPSEAKPARARSGRNKTGT